MSAISDFNKVWVQKFPGSELPAAWEEDVKNNLSKHKKRVQELEDELEKEQVYVQFLESLLEEVEKLKAEPSGGGQSSRRGNSNGSYRQERDITDVIKDTLERRCLAAAQGVRDTAIDLSNEDISEGSEQNDDVRSCSKGVAAEHREPGCGRSDPELGDDHQSEDDLDHFVTVIEVNGVEKGKAAASSQTESNQQQEDLKGRKKVPPRPPPKHFKQSLSQDAEPLSKTSNSSEKENRKDLPVAKARADRPVIFDSKKPSGNGTASSQSSTASSGSHPNSSAHDTPCPPVPKPSTNNNSGGGGKRFEGYKLPLPQVSSSHQCDEKMAAEPKDYSQSPSHLHHSSERENPNVRSRILDLVNKMESSHKPMTPSKHIEQLTPKRSNSSGKSKNSFHPHTGRHAADPMISEYINPCDAEFEENIDQIYDSPPVEPEFLEDPEPTVVERSEPRQEVQRNRKKSDTRVQQEPADLECEPMYDTVAPDQEDDYVVLLEEEKNLAAASGNSLNKRGERIASRDAAHSSSNNDLATIKSQTSVVSGHSVTTTSSGTASDAEFTGSPLPNEGKDGDFKHSANYVNIDYFLCGKSKRKESLASGESDEDEPPLLRAISFDRDFEGEPRDAESIDPNYENSDMFAASTDASSLTGSHSRSVRNETPTITAADQEKYALFRYMLTNIAESESAYVEVLNVLLQFMKALKATLATSKPVLSTDEFNIIFYKIPELFTLHQQFLQGLQQPTVKAGVGKCFENLAHEVGLYGAFLQNYSRAVDTVRKCGQNNSDFAEITRNIRLRALNKNQAVSLETLLYSPVSRVQKNVEIIQDLLKCLPSSHFDYVPLKSALKDFQSFVTEFKMIQPEQLFPGQDRNPRHLVKNSFIVELSEGHRKLRHIFLFNDVLVCAKYKASGKSEKFTFELKWYIPVCECLVVEESNEPRESNTVNLVALRSQASTVRDQIKRQTSKDDSKKAKAEKQRKKLAELEAQLVLASPNLVFKVKAGTGRSYTFFLSSEYERSQWVDAIETLKTSQPSASSNLSMHELQNWLTSCRKHLKTNMGSYLLRTGRDENLLIGDFYVLIGQLKGILRAADLYICLEVDSYGHFFRKAKTKMICESTQPAWNQDFTIELEGAQNLRILLYEDHPKQGTLIRAKTTIELNRSWLTSTPTEKKIELQDYVLTLSTKFTPSEMTIRRVPTAKPSGLFGAKITQVCKREKRQVPFILTSCVREVERRGMNEVGIYRVSGSTSDVSRLKKAFETNSYEAEQLLKDVDIHSVTGTLKLYLRELPEALFTDDLYPKLFEAFNQQDQENKRKTLLHLFSTLPPINQHNIMFLLDHMVRVNKHENHNKMSLHNLATVFGPTLLRPGIKNEGSGGTDLLAAGTVDVMAQAGILYFFLTGRADAEHIQSV